MIVNMGKTNKHLRHLQLLYAAFLGVLLLCIALFVTKVIRSDDYYTFDKLYEQLSKEKNMSEFVTVTDINLKATSTVHDFYLRLPADSTIAISAHPNRIDVALATTSPDRLSSPLVTATIVLQFATVLLLLVIFVFIFIELRTLYKAIKQGKIFQRRSIRCLYVIAIALILMSLSIDFAKYFEQCYVANLLQGSGLEIASGFNIHFVRLLFGIVILFIAEIFKIGFQMQEDQDLTI